MEEIRVEEIRMTIYLLKIREGVFTNYDSARGFVVRAPNSRTARKLASEWAGDEGAHTWLSPKCSTCQKILNSNLPKIILRDFHAG